MRVGVRLKFSQLVSVGLTFNKLLLRNGNMGGQSDGRAVNKESDGATAAG